MTERNILEIRTAATTCSGCHSRINPAGYAFEQYDTLGRYRTTEKGNLTIDPSGTLAKPGDVKASFKNGVELIKSLAKSNIFRQCFTLKMYDFYLGTRAKAAQSCEVAGLYERMKSNQFTLHSSVDALLSMSNFFLRKEVSTSTP